MRGRPSVLRRTRRGGFELRLSDEERDVLRSLPGQLREILHSGDPAVGRLFPPAYMHDLERDAEYQRLTRHDLIAEHAAALEVMESTIDSRRLEEEQVVSWLGALNSLRLVLGTRLDVTEETYEQDLAEDDPQSQGLALYFYLGWLEEQVVEALSGGLDPAGTMGD